MSKTLHSASRRFGKGDDSNTPEHMRSKNTNDETATLPDIKQ